MTGLDVVIAAYQARSTIARAVASARTVADRVVVVDDGSTDGTGAAARAAGAEVVRQENAGAAAARDRGLDAADGTYVVFLDADDTLLPDGVRRSLALLEAAPDLVAAAGRVVLVEPSGRRRERAPYPGAVTAEHLLRRGVGPWPPAAQVVRRAALLAARAEAPEPLRPRYAEDFETVLRLTQQGVVVQHDVPSCEYRVFVGKASRNAEAALRCKEDVRAHYARHLGVRTVPLTDAEIRAGAAAMRARAAWSNRRLAELAVRGPVALVRKVAAHVRRPHDRATARNDAPLVVAPWFEGGGAQHALVALLTDVGPGTVDVVSLFDGCRHDGDVTRVARSYVRLALPRSPVGVPLAALRLRRLLRGRPVVHSLLRGSHVVLGMTPGGWTAATRRGASFHQLPSTDALDRTARVEDVLVRRWTRRCHVVTAPSRRACVELVERGFADASTTTAEANAVLASSDGAAIRERSGSDGLRLLFAGRLSAQKGVDRLPAILASSPVPVWLRVAGDGELDDEVAALVAGTPSPHRVEWLGHVEEVAPYLDWSDAVILPSRFELNPVVVWEAWSRGRPVAASDIDVLRDLATVGPVLLAEHPDGWRDVLSRLADPRDVESRFACALGAFARRGESSSLRTLLRQDGAAHA